MFVIGIIIAIALGLFPEVLKWIGGKNVEIAVLGILGIFVGLVNITDKELERYIIGNVGFLMAAAALMSVLNAITLGIYTTALLNVVNNFIYFVAPGLAVVCLREIIEVSKSV